LILILMPLLSWDLMGRDDDIIHSHFFISIFY